jgi:lysozyme
MSRAVPNIAVDFVAGLEGFPPKTYLDSVGVLTGGYGHTGPDVPPVGSAITAQQAKAWLAADLITAASRLQERIGDVVDLLTENQYAALLSFVFNLGASPGWTIWRRLKDKQFDQVPGEMIKFVNAGGQKLRGLVNRRTAEIKLWSTDEPGSTQADPPSSETRAAVTPPTPSDAIPAHKSGTILTLIASSVASVPVAAKSVTDAVSPYADHSPLVGQMVAVLATVAAGSVVLGLVLAWWLKHRART